MMAVRGCFQNGASRQGGGLAVSGVIFGCPRLGESAAGIQRAEPGEPAPRPAVHSPSRRRMIRPKVSVVPQLRNSCSLGLFFLKQDSHQSFSLIIDSMPDISKRKGDTETFTVAAPSLKEYLQSHYRNLKSKPGLCKCESTGKCHEIQL